jgi:hypothetical protein
MKSVMTGSLPKRLRKKREIQPKWTQGQSVRGMDERWSPMLYRSFELSKWEDVECVF